MARKAKHDQRADGSVKFVCELCLVGVCERCIDAGRRRIGLTDPLCQCTRSEHALWGGSNGDSSD